MTKTKEKTLESEGKYFRKRRIERMTSVAFAVVMVIAAIVIYGGMI